MMKVDLHVQITRDHHVQMEQKTLPVPMSRSRCAQMEHSPRVPMGQLQGGQAVRMDPHPRHALMEQTQPVLMELLSLPVLMEGNQGAEQVQLQCVMMEQLHVETQSDNILGF